MSESTKIATKKVGLLAGAALEDLSEVCHEANTDTLFYVPIVIVAGIEVDADGARVIASTCTFNRTQPINEVAKLLRITAQHLNGEMPEEASSATITVGGTKS